MIIPGPSWPVVFWLSPSAPWPIVFCPVESAWWSSGFNNSHLVINWYTYVIIILWKVLTRTRGVGLNTRYNTVYAVYPGSKRQTDLRSSTNNSKFSRSGVVEFRFTAARRIKKQKLFRRDLSRCLKFSERNLSKNLSNEPVGWYKCLYRYSGWHFLYNYMTMKIS